jgi:hypothetical protein
MGCCPGGQRSGICAGLDYPPARLSKEGAGRLDRDFAGEREHVSIAGDEDGALGLGQGDQVVVAAVAAIGGTVSRVWRVGGEDRPVAEERCERGRLVLGYALAELGVGERAFEPGEQGVGDDELELAAQPVADELRRGAGWGEQGGDQDVGVEEGAHSAPAPARGVLGLDGERECLLFV